MARYLLDSCIWRDFYEDRVSLKGNPLGRYAARLFARIIKEKSKVLYSNVLLKELSDYAEKKDVNDMLGVLYVTGILEKVEISEKEMSEAIKLAQKKNVPVGDCLQVILARNNNATVITQDKHFFNELSGIVKVVRPQEII